MVRYCRTLTTHFHKTFPLVLSVGSVKEVSSETNPKEAINFA